jgi:hypothetical protein
LPVIEEVVVTSAGLPDETDDWRDGVLTRLGGLLYLINLMQHLDLPACFEESWRLSSQVGAWGMLELLGRALLRPEHAHLAGDRIWTALAQLDGRRVDEPPGAVYQETGSDELPAPWLAATADHSLPLVRPLARLPWLQPVNPRLFRWLVLVMPFIEWRLRQALPAAEDLAVALLLVNGRLFVTSTHVDLVLRLEDASLPLRQAGLDFDPGWVPAFGRVVQFHFE